MLCVVIVAAAAAAIATGRFFLLLEPLCKHIHYAMYILNMFHYSSLYMLYISIQLINCAIFVSWSYIIISIRWIPYKDVT